ncbi:unnamed protein product [Thlaspi arvense]|uniref:Cytochrome P450 n=1 Tax=Thlaspi arvense TaxID=13288 RepID=A0AAU9RLC1_THLAR|nr:unnamed protein product [Thlaspi arvense]
MIWAMAELIRNPRVMKKAQDEIRTSIKVKPKERIVEEDLDKLQYLKLAVKETLRLHPAAPLLLPRETMSPIKIQGYDIPSKTLLLVNAWSIAREPKHWEKPEEFIPERFMDGPVDYRGQSFEMLPFGSGRRMCPGMAYGIATVELGLLNLLYFFHWKIPEEKDMDMEEAGDVTVVKKVPLELLPVLCASNRNIYFAGVDTSAITMIWAMAELVRNPRVMKKVQDEIQTCIGIKQKERIVEEDIDKLQYLKLVVKETLRLHPAAPLLLPRETMSPIKIQGYDIPPKTILVVNAWSIGRDPKHWEDPEEFIPERFIDCPVDYKGNSFEMLPFGSGRRMCPGMASGIATIELGLLNLLYYFDWRLPEEKADMDMEEAGVVTAVKKVPLELLPLLRQ